MKATIYFPNDPSVGMFPASYEIELPFESFEDMETPSDNGFGLCVRQGLKAQKIV